MDDKYTLVHLVEDGLNVTRIKALRDGENFIKGDVGCRVDGTSSISQYDESWADFDSELVNTRLTGNVHVTSSRLVDSELLNVTGRIDKSYLAHASLYGATVSIDESTFPLIAGTATLNLTTAYAKFSCGATMSGKVGLNDVQMDTFPGADLPVQISDSTVQHSKFKSPATITDTFIYKCRFEGLMRIERSLMTNSSVTSDGGNYPAVRAPSIVCLQLVGSNVRIPDGKTALFTSGICISDIECDDLSSVMTTIGRKVTVVRVPGSKWCIQFNTDSPLAGTKVDIMQSMTDATMYKLLDTASGDQLGDALELANICIGMACGEVDAGTRKSLRRLRRKLRFRLFMWHVSL